MYGSRVDKYLPSTYGKTGYPSSGGKPGAKPAAKPMAKPASKGSSAATKAKVIGGTVAAIALAAKGGSAGRSAAAKLAPGLAKSAVGKALLGSGKPLTSRAFATAKAAPKPYAAKVTVGPKGSFGKTTMQQAKGGKGTPSEYSSRAGQLAARKTIQSRMSGPDAARASANKVTVGKKGSFGATTLSKKTKSK
jgi:hypothetical protein